MNHLDNFYSKKEASEILEVSYTWIDKLVKVGKLKKYKRLNGTFFLKSQVNELNIPQPVKSA